MQNQDEIIITKGGKNFQQLLKFWSGNEKNTNIQQVVAVIEPEILSETFEISDVIEVIEIERDITQNMKIEVVENPNAMQDDMMEVIYAELTDNTIQSVKIFAEEITGVSLQQEYSVEDLMEINILGNQTLSVTEEFIS